MQSVLHHFTTLKMRLKCSIIEMLTETAVEIEVSPSNLKEMGTQWCSVLELYQFRGAIDWRQGPGW